MVEREVIVIGAGPAGLAAALALATKGADVLIAAPRDSVVARRSDTRTSALLAPSVDFLSNIGAEPFLREGYAPLKGIRLVDAAGGLVRAPEVVFNADELGTEQFGVNIANADLVAGLFEAARAQPRVRFVDTARAVLIKQETKRVVVELAEGQALTARLVVAADGRQSIGRAAIGAAVADWAYPQTAIAVAFGHTQDHQQISTEFHRVAGPLTTVPLPMAMARAEPLTAPFASSLVWVEQPEEATRLMALEPTQFTAELERHLQGLLGTITSLSRRAAYPLTAERVSPLAGNRTVLVGEAGHVLPPIGAQGLNLGLRDAAEIAGLVGRAIANGRDIGGDDVLSAYQSARRIDVATRTGVIDGFNRALIAEGGPLGVVPSAARVLGLTAIAAIGPLRRLVMQAGLEPFGGRPSLMARNHGSARR